VQILRTEVLLEFIGDADGTDAPRLASPRSEPDKLARRLRWSMSSPPASTRLTSDLVRPGPHLTQPPDIPDPGSQERATLNAGPEALARLLAEEARLALAGDRENREDREPAATRSTGTRV
jgi:hypothetical protein